MRLLAFLLLATAACAQTTFPAWVFQKKTSASSASVPVVISGQNNKVFGLDGSGNPAMLPIGGSSTLAGLSDVTIAAQANLDVLQYDTNLSKWVNVSSSSGGQGVTDSGKVVLFDAGGRLNGTSIVSAGDNVLPGFVLFYNADNSYYAMLRFTGTDSAPEIDLPTSSGTLLLANGSGANLTALNASNIASGTLSVSHGGTGSTSLTANNVLLGNGTSALQTVAPGTSGNVLTSNGTTWTSAAPAAGAAPGGSGSEIQYRSGASTFGAVTGSSVSGATLSLAGKLTVDGSADVAQLVIQGHSTQTSALQEWQNSGGTQVAKVNNSGTLFAVPSGGGFLMKRNDSSDNNTGVYSPDTVSVGFATANTGVFYASSNYGAQLHSSGYLGISTTPHVGGTADVRLYRDDAGVLALRNSTTPQTVRVYETDSGSNDEYVEINAASGTNYIKPAATGTGTASKLDHYVTSSVFITSGAGSPEAAVTAPVGSLFIRTDGGASTTLYVKESGSGNTGWVAK